MELERPVVVLSAAVTNEAHHAQVGFHLFLIIAIVAGLFGFTGVEEASATIAKWLAGIFLVLFLGAIVVGLAIGAKLTS